MGQSTDAILAYGINLDEEGSDPWEICESLQYDRYADAEAAKKELGIDLIQHCSNGCPMYIIGVEHLRAWRGEPKEVDPAGLLLDEKATRAKIQAYCERFGLPFSDDACKWYLASNWG